MNYSRPILALGLITQNNLGGVGIGELYHLGVENVGLIGVHVALAAGADHVNWPAGIVLLLGLHCTGNKMPKDTTGETFRVSLY